MIISANRSRFKKIAIALLLLTFSSWSHEGFVICYGADGHVAIEQPIDKDCCKTQEKCVQTTLSEQSEFVHCVDVPIGSEKYIPSASHTSSFQNYGLSLSIVSPLLFSLNQPGPVVYNFGNPPPHNPLLAVLKTVVLLI